MTRDELVEKVARAICAGRVMKGDETLVNVFWPDYIKDADRAIRLIVEECARVADDQDDVVLVVEAIRSLLPEGA